MKIKTRIIIAGIGGVGGFFGGHLAKYYEKSVDVSVVFLARGEHLKKIQKNGLVVISGTETITAHPALATNNAHEIGIADFILICTKSYDLTKTVEQLKPCIGKKTVLIPLLNGVDAKETIEGILPTAHVFNGCVYIVSRLKEPGVVEFSGINKKLYFGVDGTVSEECLLLETLLKNALIDVTLLSAISATVWEKFIFIASFATATAYFDCNKGELLADENKMTTVKTLIDEVSSIARAKRITVHNDIEEHTLKKITMLLDSTTSSMHSDFKNRNRNTELEAITGYVIRTGNALNIPVPGFLKAYNDLKQRL